MVIPNVDVFVSVFFFFVFYLCFYFVSKRGRISVWLVIWIDEKKMPVIVQANCVRIHSHSNSDRHDLYRDDQELNYVAGYDPVAKYRRMLLRYNRFTVEELESIEAEIKAEVKEAHKKAITSPDPDPASIHDFVIADAFVSQKYPLDRKSVV